MNWNFGMDHKQIEESERRKEKGIHHKMAH